jgi:GUN4-like
LAYEFDFFGDVRVRKIRSGITCENLKRINDLWDYYSKGKFGFKSQLEEFRKRSTRSEKSYEYWKWNKYIILDKSDWHWTIGRIPEETPKGFLPSNLWMLASSPKPMRDISSNLEKYEACTRK